MSDEWRSTEDDLPDWKESGDAEFLKTDGTTCKGCISLDEIFDGIPFAEVFVPDAAGERMSFFDFTHWRLIK